MRSEGVKEGGGMCCRDLWLGGEAACFLLCADSDGVGSRGGPPAGEDSSRGLLTGHHDWLVHEHNWSLCLGSRETGHLPASHTLIWLSHSLACNTHTHTQCRRWQSGICGIPRTLCVLSPAPNTII